MEFLVNSLVESRQIISIGHLCTVVHQQGGEHLLVRCLVPFLTIIVELDILFLGLILRTLHLHAPVAFPCTGT